MQRSDNDPASEELCRGIAEFNRGAWFQCHETFEELWVGAGGAERSFYQGVLQVAVALHHWREGNYRGALHLCASAQQLLHRAEPCCGGVDVTRLIGDTARFGAALAAAGPAGMAALPAALIPRLHPCPDRTS